MRSSSGGAGDWQSYCAGIGPEGAEVAIAARSKEPTGESARELAAETGQRVIPLPADVTSQEQVDRMVAEAARQFGGLHILVNSGSSLEAPPPAPSNPVRRGFAHRFQRQICGGVRCARAAIPT